MVDYVDYKIIVIPDRPWDDVTENLVGHSFATCFYFHPASDFTLNDIKEIEVVEDDANDGEGSFEWNLTLRDGRRYNVQAWHDYTGWECRSGAEYTLIEEN